MSCAAVRHQFENERKKGLTFEKALDIYREVDGSVAAHRVELAELKKADEPEAVKHLESHIAEGEKLLQEIRRMKLG
ncbi:MAG: hypothetical protein IBX71_11065 [Candidatus Desulforudis sp.]|nr:hypothetical protein [Desulforudis sp.]